MSKDTRQKAEVRFNFILKSALKEDLDRIAQETGRSGAADILRQLASEYARWWRSNRGDKPAWVQSLPEPKAESPQTESRR